MAVWRMAFRSSNGGPSVWPQCLRLGIAAITYRPIADIDLRNYPEREPSGAWLQLSPSQHSSLASVAYEMCEGDVIYVKEGSSIVGKGTVFTAAGAPCVYQFDRLGRIIDPLGEVWRHQVPVRWEPDFTPVQCQIGTSQQFAVQQIGPDDVDRLESLCRAHGAVDPIASPYLEFLSEESYYRECSVRMKVILREHNKLSNAFRAWLDREHGVAATQEREQVDIKFKTRGKTVMAELKVCFGTGTRKAIREALGQVLEYNHFDNRTCQDEWLIVLDEGPTAPDFEFIYQLRSRYRLPLFVGWRHRHGFQFAPQWPNPME